MRRNPRLAPARRWPRLTRGLALGVGFSLSLGAWAGLALVLVPWATGPGLRLHHIEVAGGRRLGPEAALAQAELALGSLSWRLSLADLAARLQAHPWVQAATVQRRLPDRVRVDLVEHRPRLLVAHGALQVANDSGELFKPLAAADRLALPVLTGAGGRAEGALPERLRRDVLAGLALVDRLAAHSERLGTLDELHIDEAMGWSAVLRHPEVAPDGARVHLGHAPLERVAWLVKAFDLLVARGEKVTAIWADGEQHPDRVHVERPT